MTDAQAKVPRILLIGLDVGDGRLLRRWAEEGRLPTFARLIESGSWQWLATPAEVLHVAAWPSIYTGAPPGQHGVYFTFQPRRGVQGWSMFDSGLFGRPTFWHLLGEAGVRCTVFDAPYVHPEGSAGVTQVLDWGTWAHHWRTSSQPPDLLPRLQRACGRYPLGMEALDIGLVAVDSGDMRQRLARAVEAKASAAIWLMDRQAWDLFFVVFGETHPAAHYCWRPIDGPAASADLLAVYQSIDRAIERLVDRAGDETSVYVMSGDGVGANHGGWHLLPEVLRRLGFLVEPTPDEAPPPKDLVRRLRDMLPKDFRKGLARKLPSALRHRLAKRVDTAAIDWTRTRAYCLPTDLEGYVRVNVRGREPQGIVDPESEYDEVCEQLTEKLLALRDPAGGAPVVREVIRVDGAFPGPRADQLPDLVILWEAGLGQLPAMTSEQIGTVRGEPVDRRPGTHAPPGFLLGVPVGERRAEPPNGHVQDLAPALLTHFGVEVPPYMTSRTSPVVPYLQEPR